MQGKHYSTAINQQPWLPWDLFQGSKYGVLANGQNINEKKCTYHCYVKCSMSFKVVSNDVQVTKYSTASCYPKND